MSIPNIPGLGIEDLRSVETIGGDELIEISLPVTLNNGMVSYQSFKTTVNKILALYSARRDNPNLVTANQTGAYSRDEVDEIIRTRFGEGTASLNAERLGGSTKEEIIEEARSGTSADSNMLGGQTPDHYAKTQEVENVVNSMIETFNSYTPGE